MVAYTAGVSLSTSTAHSCADLHAKRGGMFNPGTLERSVDPLPCAHDDLESFFWVLLFLVFRCRYAPVRWTVPSEVPSFKLYLDDLFNFQDCVEKGRSLPTDTFDIPKLAFLHPRYPHPSGKSLRTGMGSSLARESKRESRE